MMDLENLQIKSIYMIDEIILTKSNCNIIIRMYTLKAVIERIHDATVSWDISKARMQGGHDI